MHLSKKRHAHAVYNSIQFLYQTSPGSEGLRDLSRGFYSQMAGVLVLPSDQQTSLSLEIGSIGLRHTTIRYTMHDADVKSLEVFNSVRIDVRRQ